MNVYFNNAKIILRSKSVETRTMFIGNDVQDLILNSYLADRNRINLVASASYGVSPYIDISSLASDISLTNATVPADGFVVCAFYDESNNYISELKGQTSGGGQSLTISKSDVPSNAKFFRFTASYASNVSTSSGFASKVEYKVLIIS